MPKKIEADYSDEVLMDLLKEKMAKKAQVAKPAPEPLDDEVIMNYLRTKVSTPAPANKATPKQLEHLAKARLKRKLIADEKKKAQEKAIQSQVDSQIDKKMKGSGVKKANVVTPRVKNIEADEEELIEEHERDLEKEQKEMEKQMLMHQYLNRYGNAFG